MRQHFINIIFIFILSVFPTTAYGNDNVNIKATAHKKTVILGEPLVLTVKISNTGDDTTSFQVYGREFYSNHLNLGKVQVDEKEVNHRMGPPGKPSSNTVIGLKPGEEKTERFIILFNAKTETYTFQDVDKYKLMFKYSGHRNPNEVEIKVEQPDKESDQAVWKNYLKEDHRKAYGRLIHAPWQFNTKYSVTKNDRKLFHELINNYEESNYTPYMTFSLARNYSYLSVYDEDNAEKYKKKAKNLFNKTLELTENKMLKEFTKTELKKLEKESRDQREIWIGK